MMSAPIHVNVSVQCAGVAAWRLRLLAAVARLLSIPVLTCRRLDGRPMFAGPDGWIHGEPLNLTDAERARMPKLDAAGNSSPVRGIWRGGAST